MKRLLLYSSPDEGVRIFAEPNDEFERSDCELQYHKIQKFKERGISSSNKLMVSKEASKLTVNLRW